MTFRFFILNYISNCIGNSHRKLFWKWAFTACEVLQVIMEYDPLTGQDSQWNRNTLAPVWITSCPSNWWKNIQEIKYPSLREAVSLYQDKHVLWRAYVMTNCSWTEWRGRGQHHWGKLQRVGSAGELPTLPGAQNASGLLRKSKCQVGAIAH